MSYEFWGLIFGGAYTRRGFFSEFYGIPFLLSFTLYLRAISKYKPPRGLYLEGRFNGGFLVWKAYIWRGSYMEELVFGILRYLFKSVTPTFTLNIPGPPLYVA